MIVRRNSKLKNKQSIILVKNKQNLGWYHIILFIFFLSFFLLFFDLPLLNSKGEELGELLKTIRPFFQTIPKAKTEKIGSSFLNTKEFLIKNLFFINISLSFYISLVWTLIGMVAEIPNSLDLQIDLCKESIAWAKAEKRTFLRHKIESKLAELLVTFIKPKNFTI